MCNSIMIFLELTLILWFFCGVYPYIKTVSMFGIQNQSLSKFRYKPYISFLIIIFQFENVVLVREHGAVLRWILDLCSSQIFWIPSLFSFSFLVSLFFMFHILFKASGLTFTDLVRLVLDTACLMPCNVSTLVIWIPFSGWVLVGHTNTLSLSYCRSEVNLSGAS